MKIVKNSWLIIVLLAVTCSPEKQPVEQPKENFKTLIRKFGKERVLCVKSDETNACMCVNVHIDRSSGIMIYGDSQIVDCKHAREFFMIVD